MKLYIQIVHTDNETSSHLLSKHTGWRISVSNNVLTIGTGIERTIIPLCNVRYFTFYQDKVNGQD